MGVIETKIFKSGNSAAVRLPADLGFEVGTTVRLARRGHKLVIEPVFDVAEHRRQMRELADEIERIWADAPYHEIQEREPIEFPDRPGL